RPAGEPTLYFRPERLPLARAPGIHIRLTRRWLGRGRRSGLGRVRPRLRGLSGLDPVAPFPALRPTFRARATTAAAAAATTPAPPPPAGALSPPNGSGSAGAGGSLGGTSSIRGLKFGSISTTPIFGISGGATRGPREPRRNRALREGIPATGACAGRMDGGAEDS